MIYLFAGLVAIVIGLAVYGVLRPCKCPKCGKNMEDKYDSDSFNATCKACDTKK